MPGGFRALDRIGARLARARACVAHYIARMDPARVFVLCTGRCGSLTFTRACEHIANWSSGHESRTSLVGPARLAYPERHIEVDNRLSWFLGRLHHRFDDERTLYVHLRRDLEATVESFMRRWGRGIIKGYAKRIVSGATDLHEPREICRDYVRTVNANIEQFLDGRENSMSFRLEDASETFPEFWREIGADGDLEAAMLEWTVRHNASSASVDG